jgi:hypothetical protein
MRPAPPALTLATTLALTLAVAAAPATADVFLFKMPSNNVVCSVGQEADSADITCTIHERSGPLPRPAPADCMSTWGHVFTLRDTGPVTMECTDFDRGLAAAVTDVAPYGVTGTFGGISCLSQETGLRCTNRDGHGFQLARRTQSVF